MPLPPLAASERRLAQLANAVSWGCFFLGCVAGAAAFTYANASTGERLFAAVAGGGLYGIAASLRRTASSPRDHRQGFLPLLVLLMMSGLSLFLAWARHPSERLLGEASLACGILFAAFGWIYFRAAPGVNLSAVVAPPADAPAKAVQLGVRAAPAPIPAAPAAEAAAEAAVEPKAASGASLG